MGRSSGIEWVMQMSANLVGTVLAAGVIYGIGVIAGAITPNDMLNILTSVAGLLILIYITARMSYLLRARAND